MFKLYLYGIEMAEAAGYYEGGYVLIVPLWN